MHIWKKYIGTCDNDGYSVEVEEYHDSELKHRHPLMLHLAVRNHSPSGFAWGYAGSGPAQLALAILIDHYSLVCPDQAISLALENYQNFKWAKIANLDGMKNFVLTTDEVSITLLSIGATVCG